MNRPAWHAHAACRGGEMIPIFFPKMITQRHLETVQAICSSCPVRQQCAESGHGEAYGIWAGAYDYERQRARRR